MHKTYLQSKDIDVSLCPCQVLPHQKESMTATLIDDDTDNSYTKCCSPYHTYDKLPETAEQLMRSRYAAFVLHDIDYIVETTLPFQQSLLDKKSISNWSKETFWLGLEVIHHRAKAGKNHAQVEFKAWVQANDANQFHHELSSFVRMVDKKWYFIDPTVNMNITQKQPCICGSSEKFKRCCGAFLRSHI